MAGKRKKKASSRSSRTSRWWMAPLLFSLRTLSWLLVLGGLALGMWMGAASLWNALTRHPSFSLTAGSISFPEPEYVNEAAMRDVVRARISDVIGEGAHIFDRELPGAVGEKLLELPWVVEVEDVRRQLPDRLWADVRFREPAGKVELAGREYLIDIDGFYLPGELYKARRDPEDTAMPVIVHKRLRRSPPRGGQWEGRALPVGARLCRFLVKESVLEVLDIKEIDVTHVGEERRRGLSAQEVDVSLLTGSGATVRWGTTDEYDRIEGLTRRVDEPGDRRKVQELKRFLHEYPRLEGVEYIDLRLKHTSYKPASTVDGIEIVPEYIAE